MTGGTLSWSHRRFGPGVFKWKTRGLLLLGPVGPVPCFNEMVRPFGSGKLYVFLVTTGLMRQAQWFIQNHGV